MGDTEHELRIHFKKNLNSKNLRLNGSASFEFQTRNYITVSVTSVNIFMANRSIHKNT